MALYHRLAERFGEDQLFKDIDNIRLGEDFVQKITQEVEACDILLALIGTKWLEPDANGRRRIDDPNDFVYLEIKTALERGVMLIPILVDGAPMPSADSLPSDIGALVRRQALELNPNLFKGGTDQLLEHLESTLSALRAHISEPKPPTPTPMHDAQVSTLGDNPWTPDLAARYLLMLGKRNPSHLRMILEAGRDRHRSIDRASVAECLGREEDAPLMGLTRPFDTVLKALAERTGMNPVPDVPMYPVYGEGWMTRLALEHDFDAVLDEATAKSGSETLGRLSGFDRDAKTAQAKPDHSEEVDANAIAQVAGDTRTLPITFDPPDTDDFKEALIASKAAWIEFRFDDGRVEREPWLTHKFTHTSSLLGNLRSRPKLRTGNWQAEGIATVHVMIATEAELSHGAGTAHPSKTAAYAKPRFCPNCGDPVDVDEITCDKCGMRLIDAVVREAMKGIGDDDPHALTSYEVEDLPTPVAPAAALDESENTEDDPALTKASSSNSETQRDHESWNGHDWYVSFGEYPNGRTWTDAVKYGFVSAGGGEWYSQSLRKLPRGARVFVCIPGTGFVGVGTVVGEPAPFDAAIVTVDGATHRLAELELAGTYHHSPEGDTPETAEYVVPIDWQRTVHAREAVWRPGMFANQHSACKLRHSSTIDQVSAAFGLDAS